jgi:hypothetical protein
MASVTLLAVFIAEPGSVLPGWLLLPLSIICLALAAWAFWIEKRPS